MEAIGEKQLANIYVMMHIYGIYMLLASWLAAYATADASWMVYSAVAQPYSGAHYGGSCFVLRKLQPALTAAITPQGSRGTYTSFPPVG